MTENFFFLQFSKQTNKRNKWHTKVMCVLLYTNYWYIFRFKSFAFQPKHWWWLHPKHFYHCLTVRTIILPIIIIIICKSQRVPQSTSNKMIVLTGFWKVSCLLQTCIEIEGLLVVNIIILLNKPRNNRTCVRCTFNFRKSTHYLSIVRFIVIISVYTFISSSFSKFMLVECVCVCVRETGPVFIIWIFFGSC